MFGKRIVKGLVLALLIVVLVACGDSDGTSGDSDDVTLRIAWWGSQARHDRTVEVIELYEEQNSHVDIQFEFFDFDGYFTKLNTLVNAEDVWDIFQLGGNYPTYIDIIEPLNSYIEDDYIDMSDSNETYIEPTTDNDGNVVGISLGVNSYGIAYNPEMFADAGVEEPADNWTWEDYEEANLKIHEELGVFGTSILDDFLAGALIGVGPDDNFFDGDDDTKLDFDDPGLLVDYIALRKRLVDAGAYPDPGAAAEVTDIENDFVATGEAAMTWVATNQFKTLSEASGVDLKLANMPRRNADDPYSLTLNSSQMFSVPTSSEQKEEAAKFISFFINDPDANEILAGERGVPITSKVRDALEKIGDPLDAVVFDYIDYVGEQETDHLNTIENPKTAEIRSQYELYLDQVIFDEKTPEEAAQDLYDFAADLIKE